MESTMFNVVVLLLSCYVTFLAIDLFVSYKTRAEYLHNHLEDTSRMSYFNIFRRTHMVSLVGTVAFAGFIFVLDLIIDFIK